MSEVKQIAIVGGGITGLTTAYYLQKEIKEKGLPFEVKLYEAGDRLGGMIHTERKDGFTIERGPDSLLARKTSVFRLIEDVGLQDKLVDVAAGKAYVLANEKLHGIPQGSFMGIPTQVTPFALSSLFSPMGKLRAAGIILREKRMVTILC